MTIQVSPSGNRLGSSFPKEDDRVRLQSDLHDTFGSLRSLAQRKGMSPRDHLVNVLGPDMSPFDNRYKVVIEEDDLVLFTSDEVTKFEEGQGIIRDFQWDVGLDPYAITRAEYAAMVKVGHESACAQGIKLEIPRMDDDELRKFVHDYLAGHIYTDADVPASLVSMVFMPLFFGAMSLPDHIDLSDGPQVGAEPDRPSNPQEPSDPKYPEYPKKPDLVEPSQEEIEQAEFEKRWSLFDEGNDPLEILHQICNKKNKEAMVTYWEQHKEWKKQCRSLKAEHKKALQAYQEALQAHQEAFQAYHEAYAEWEVLGARADAFMEGFYKEWCSDLGCIWESVENRNVMSRSVNGFPIFTSLRRMHREDWRRATAAINRELERRKKIEI